MAQDVFDLQAPGNASLTTFSACNIGSLFVATKMWEKPRGVTMVYMICIGGGGGGGGGGSTGGQSGGGGGGCSGQTRLLLNAALVPDVLYLSIGYGGVGGAANVSGSNGTLSAVALIPNNNALDTYCVSGAAAATGGQNGFSGAAAGTASTVATSSIMCLYGIGNFLALAGQNGASGGASSGAVGNSIALPTTGISCTGGAGGGGGTAADFGGGGFTAVSNVYLSDIRPIATAAGATPLDGSAGLQIYKPFFGFGGCGGATAIAGTGGAGGNGIAYGVGGGGGGGGVTGGTGGDGGPGAVMIFCW